MAREHDLGPAQLAHHYAHIACQMIETRKGSNCAEDTAAAIDKTIKGVCELIDSFVTQEHKEQAKTGGAHQ
jgi:hypothetical protein